MRSTSLLLNSLWIVAFFIIFTGIISFKKETGGHPGTTRAPGEPSCAYTGCHNGPVMSGDLVSTFSFSNPDSSYLPGQTYSITLTMNKPGIDKFGFELVAIQDSTELNIGEFTITDSSKTHMIDGYISGQQRWYMTHTLDGSVAPTPGSTSWTFDWTAPNYNAGNITFYYGLNCANNDGMPTGDEIYTSSFQIHPSSATQSKEILFSQSLNLWKPQNDNLLIVEFDLKNRSQVVFELTDANGKLILIQKKTLQSGHHKEQLETPDSIRKGVYFLKITVDRKQQLTKKIVW